MSVQMALLCAAVFGVAVGVIRMPKWFARKVHRHRLWRVRDGFVDDLIDGHLPRDHPAVVEFLGRIEGTIANYNVLTPSWFLVSRLIWRVGGGTQLDRELDARMAPHLSLDGLSPDEQEALENYREWHDVLLTGSVLLGSWVGLGVVAFEVVVLVFRSAARSLDLRPLLRQAVDRLASRSGIGHWISQSDDLLVKHVARL
ncbi:MAG TPA: hypothetical protein VEA78_04210 [Acidimicrobiales bacterium]|nr:hypothetical protein [Acidimicrobiales bacterium]